jgi:thiol:disulfide interchange protein DsbA
MKTLFRALVVLAALSPLACSAADTDAPYKLGEHYLRVRAAQEPANPAKIEVMEIYAYSCPHCFNLEPVVEKWLKKKPADVEFVRNPNTLGHDENEMRNRAYYAARLLGVADRFHPALFEAIHRDRKPMATPEALRALFIEKTGLKGEDFDGAVNSFAADAGFRRGESAAQAMGVTRVPTLVVDGKYMVPANLAKSYDDMLKAVDFLVGQARKERAKR